MKSLNYWIMTHWRFKAVFGHIFLQLFILSSINNCLSLPFILKITERSQKGEECDGHKQGEFVPNPFDCSKFFYCLQGGKSAEAECPNGMLFNREKRLCDQESNVRCMPSEDNDDNTVRELAMIEHYCATKAFQLYGRIEYISSTISCNHYYICSLGLVQQQKCPSRLHWNAKIRKCDFPANADCSERFSGGITTGHLIKCPPLGQQVFAHLQRCDYFVYCVKGHAILQQCPFFYEFDFIEKSCKLRKNARCVTEFL